MAKSSRKIHPSIELDLSQIGLRNKIPRFEFFIGPSVSLYIWAFVGQSGMIWLKLQNTTI